MEAFVTLLYEDSYLPGVLVLGHRLREVGVGGRKVVVLVTNGVSLGAKAQLAQIYDQVINVESISNHGSGVEEEFALLKRPELDRVFTKINAWRLDQFAKCVFLDADILVLKNIVELFRDEVAPVNKHTIAGAPDVGWPDIFNSGVFVFQPDHQVFEELLDASLQGASFDGGDQGLLNQYFDRPGKHWHRLPFTYNVTPSMSYQYTPAFRYFEHKVSIVHFTGTAKPWKDAYHKHHHVYEGSHEFVSRWWDIALRHPDVEELLRPPVYAHVVEPTPEPEESQHEESKPESEQLHGPDPRFDAFGGYAHSEAQTILPAVDRWDPVRSVPPRGSQPQAVALNFEQYQNAWDQPHPPPAHFVEEQQHRGGRSHVQFAVDDEQHMAHFVEEETHHHHHHHHHHNHEHSEHNGHHDETSTHEQHREEEPTSFVQDFGPSIFKFPWEERAEPAAIERVFPGYEPQTSEAEESEPDHEHSEEELVDEELEEEEDEDDQEAYHDESGYDTDVAHQEEDEVRLGIAKPGFHNFRDRENAWDADPYIQNYMTRHVRRTSSMGIEDIIGNSHRRKRSVGGAGDDATTKFDEDNDEDEAVPDLVWKKSSEGNKRYQFPVTPNPIRNPFPPDDSDEDGDDDGEGEYDSDSSLPAHAQWDPAAKLEELAKLPALLLQQKLLNEGDNSNSLAPASSQSPSPPPLPGVPMNLTLPLIAHQVKEPEVSQSELTPDRQVEQSTVVEPVDIAHGQLFDKSNDASAYRKAGGTDDDVSTAVVASSSDSSVPLAPVATPSDDSANSSSGSDTEGKKTKASSLFRRFSKKA